MLSVTLNVIVVALDMAKHNTIDEIDFANAANINCPSLIERDSAISILYVVVIMLMMIVLLKYIAQFVPFLENFILIIQNVRFSVVILFESLVGEKYCFTWNLDSLAIFDDSTIWSIYIWFILPGFRLLWLLLYSTCSIAHE